MDTADQAALNQQRLNDDALEGRRDAATERDSAEYCIDCDAAIPERRRQTLPGVERCVECQEFEERKS